MKTKLLQILYDVRHQPVIAWVTFIATALSIFLIMVVVMMQRVSVVPFAPESCRDRLLLGAYIHVSDDGHNDSSAPMSYEIARKLYEGLDGVEHTSFFIRDWDPVDVKGTKNEYITAKSRFVDAEFFNIFDHKLLQGRFFTPEEVKAGIPVAIISERIAREAFGDDNPVGATIIIAQKDYRVCGVVADSSPLASTAFADIFRVAWPENPELYYGDMFGRFYAGLLVADGVDFESVREQVRRRYDELDSELAPEGKKTVYHGSPFDQEVIGAGLSGSNVTPDVGSARRMRYIIYAILLIVPAINLSSMLHSRMRRRVSEIGVRRAYGCTRSRIVFDIISENFIVTLAGGFIGVAAGVIFAYSYSGLYGSVATLGPEARPEIGALLNWTTIGIAVGLCFILNIISASVPAIQAARVNPVEAINKK